MPTVIGLDIGGTKCAVSLAYVEGERVEFLAKTKFLTCDHAGPEAVLKKLIADAKSILAEQKLVSSDIAAVGINCGGPLDSRSGVVLCPPNLPGWLNVPVAERVRRELGIPAYLQNDANAGAVAEHLFGAGRGYDHLMFLTFGTGMGAGIIVNGRLYSGASDMAGEVGHIRLAPYGPVGFGKAGSFEGFCSGGGIAQLAQTRALEKLQVGEDCGYCPSMADLPDITAQSLAEAAKSGDPLAVAVFAEAGRYVGQALSLFIDILNPQLILLGSIYGRCRELLEPHIKEVVERETIPFARRACRILPCGLGEAIGDYEAIAIAVEALS